MPYSRGTSYDRDAALVDVAGVLGILAVNYEKGDRGSTIVAQLLRMIAMDLKHMTGTHSQAVADAETALLHVIREYLRYNDEITRDDLRRALDAIGAANEAREQELRRVAKQMLTGLR